MGQSDWYWPVILTTSLCTPALQAPLLCLRKALSRAPDLQPLYSHSPALLRFIFRYPELAESFGASVLELWFTHGGRDPTAEGAELMGPDRDSDDVTLLLPLMGEKPTIVLTLLVKDRDTSR